MNRFRFLFLLLVAGLAGCLNDIDEVIVDQNTPDPEILENYEPQMRLVNASATGQVVNEQGEPVPGAEVLLNGTMTLTDDYGHFFFEDKNMNALGTLVEIRKPGFFDGSRRFFPAEDLTSRLKIELIAKNFDRSFNASSGGMVYLEGGASIEFVAGSIRKADGSPYEGEVLLATKWLDPTSPRTLDRMPGNLQGVNERNEEVALATFGMMAVELETPSGNPLNILEGSKATISMPVPSSLLPDAPTIIPLWSYNNSYGVWVEEGSAFLQDGSYVGEVSHFSFWNCDYPYPLVEFEAQLVDAAGEPLANYQVTLELGNSATGYGYSNEEGYISGLVPANEVMTLEVYNICGEVIFSQDVGPFSEDVSFGQIVVTGVEIQTTVITGTVVNCDAEPVEHGLVIASFFGHASYHYIEGGEFEISLTTCSDATEISIIGVDLGTLLQSELVTVSAEGITEAGEIAACDEPLASYLLITIDGNTAIYSDSAVVIYADSGYTFIQTRSDTSPNGTWEYVGFGFEGDTPGDYSEANFIEAIFNDQFDWTIQGGSFDYLVVTEYGGPGERIRGSFSGSLENAGNVSSISGEFDLLR